MSESLLSRVIDLISNSEIKISLHGYDELADDNILVSDVIQGINDARVVEEYPDFPKGPCILVLQNDSHGEPVHVVWGIPSGHLSPAVLVTAYRPNTDKWSEDYLRRKNE